MKHTFVSPVAEGPNSGPAFSLVGPNEWNNLHVYSAVAVSANTVLNSTFDVVFASAGTGITLTLPTAAGNIGLPFIIWNVDGGAGGVQIVTVNLQTINGQGSWRLDNQWQWIELLSNGSNWVARAGQ